MTYTVLHKLIYSHLHALTDTKEPFVFEISSKSYADPGSLLTGLQSETNYVISKDKEGITFVRVCSTLLRQEPGQRGWYSNWTID
jgi:hypothetical protein